MTPMMQVFMPGDARNCQLPSSNSQNTTSRHSPTANFVNNPDIRSPVILAGRPHLDERRRQAGHHGDCLLPQKNGSCYSKKALANGPSGLPRNESWMAKIDTANLVFNVRI